MDTPTDSPLARTGDAGGRAELAAGQLDAIKAELRHQVSRFGSGVALRRAASENILYCRWDGDSPDGRKYSENLGEQAMPFDGASDAKVRMADLILREHKRMALAAIKNPSVRGISAAGDEEAGLLAKLAEWLVRNKLTRRWSQEWEKVVHYALADSPAVAAMGVFWENEISLVERPVSLESIAEAAAQAGDPDPMLFAQRLVLVEEDKNARAYLAALFPGADSAALKKALNDLRSGGSATLLVPEVADNRPCPLALRFGDDVVVPENTADFERPRYLYHFEWLSQVDLEERVLTQGYSRAAVDLVLEHEGVTFRPGMAINRVSRLGPEWAGFTDTDQFRGLYEVITVWYRAVNEAGVPCLYSVVMHGSVPDPVRDREPSPYAHGRMPFAFYAHEHLSRRAWESRGIPELVVTDQYTVKLHADLVNDSAQLTTIPPIMKPANRPDLSVNLSPLGENTYMRGDEIKPLTLAGYPSTALTAGKETWKRVNEYFGRPVEGVAPQIVTGYAQGFIDNFLPTVEEALHQMVALALQYMGADELERIAIGLGRFAGMDPRELRGRYNFVVTFDARTLDANWLATLGELFGKYVLSWDTLSSVERDKAVRWFSAKLDPDTLQFIRPVESATRDELKDEDNNFAFIAAGGEPEMVGAGQNYAARFQRLLANATRNPEAVASWPETNRAVLNARLEHLRFMQQQGQNADIGRVGAKPALDGR